MKKAQRYDVILLEKMEAIYTINQEIIERISSKESFSSYSYHLQIINNRVELVEKEHKQEYEEFMDKFTLPKSPSIIPIDDLFKDKLDYSCRKFTDICRLNENMLRIAKQYSMFGGSQESIEVLELFKSNYEVLQVLLGDIEAKYTNIISYHEDFEERVKSINNSVVELENTLKKVSYLSTQPFVSSWIIHRNPWRIINERVIETLTGQSGCALAHTQWRSVRDQTVWRVRLENYPKNTLCSGWFQFACITQDMLSSSNFYSNTALIISDSEFSHSDNIEITMDLATSQFSCGVKAYEIKYGDNKQVALAVLVNYGSCNIPPGVKIILF